MGAADRTGAAATASMPALPALLDPLVARFIGEGARLQALAERHGSPLNIVWPHAVPGNARAMRLVLERHGVEHEIFYAAKVNKSRALLRAAVAAGAGVDVSSLPEFEDALRAGAPAARICATGPAKTASFHRALVAAGALIAVDSPEELVDLEREAGGRRARVLLRLRPPGEEGSRFGMAAPTLAEALRSLSRVGAPVAFEGFHMHLASYRVADRVAAMPLLLDLVERAAALGLEARTLDIGGGMPVRYVDPDRYAAALQAQGPADYRDAAVPAAFYPYGSDATAADWLDDFLAAPCRGASVAAALRRAGLRLAIEPGRSLVDQAAVSIFRITRVKPLEAGRAVIFVEGSSFSACETWFRSEFLVDPILVPRDVPRDAPLAAADAAGAVRAYIAGHSCLGDDVVTNRWLGFPAAPRAGDLLIYANTAGYQMDLLENEFHRHPMPTRLFACLGEGGDPFFIEDK